jgi:hypothetical protein
LVLQTSNFPPKVFVGNETQKVPLTSTDRRKLRVEAGGETVALGGPDQEVALVTLVLCMQLGLRPGRSQPHRLR